MQKIIARTTVFLLVLAVALFFFGCKKESPVDATLTVTVDTDCEGMASNIAVYVDDNYVGTLQPGGSLDSIVTIGEHELYAECQEGHWWGPETKSIGSSGYTWSLICEFLLK